MTEVKEMFRLVNRETGIPQPVYFQFRGEVEFFDTPIQARTSNCHDLYKDLHKWRVDKVRITVTTIKTGVDDE